jgi:glycosyltransferase involved in cell wall biosynthesis
MRLLYITNGITGVGGLERVLAIRTAWFVERLGYEVHIASLDEAGREPFYKFSPAVVRHNVEKRHYFDGLRSVVREVRPDIVAVCDDAMKGFFVPLWLGHLGPMILERHCAREMTPRGGWLMRLGIRLYDRFVVLTAENARQWPGPGVRVIPNPLAFYPVTVSPLDSQRVIAVGKVTHHKGYDRLLAAWRAIEADHPGWRVDIFGAQNDGGELERSIRATKQPTGHPPGGDGGAPMKSHSDESFKINPPTPDIESEYLASAICALPSRHEGFGMTLTEAMACGVPCVAMDCPCGPRDIIRDGEDGILVPDGDITAFAHALATLMDNDSLRHKMGNAARRNVTRYDIKNVAKLWVEMFEELT